jgi:hypothetical protein
VGDTVKDKEDIGPDEASRLIKEFAEQQKIRIELTEEQLAAISDQWEGMDVRSPAEITFYVGERAAASLKVAGYTYSGDTCCV